MKRLLLTAIAVYVVGFLVAFLFHDVLLGKDYQAISALLRPEAEMKMAYIIVGYAFWALGIAWLYGKGVEAKPWVAQGLRFGLALACVWAVPWDLVNYATLPIPFALAMKGLAADVVNALACGLVAAAINRRPATA
jgi:hypothetical protein